MNSKKEMLVILLLTLLILPLSIQTQVVTDFEEGDFDGWYSEGDGYDILESGTGNPGYCLRVNDYATGDINKAIAPLKFTGDWSAATITDSFRYDFKIVSSSSVYTSNWAYILSGPGGSAEYIPGDATPATNVWNTYSAPIDSTEWSIISGSWSELVQNINLIKLRAEFINGSEHVKIDNIELSFTPFSEPIQPLIITDFESGFDGWGFNNTGSISIKSTGGNPDSYCYINDDSGISTAIAPPKFLGSWVQLVDSAEIVIDCKIISNSNTEWLNEYFIKISGPGGEAAVHADTTKLLNAIDKWESFSLMIKESEWDLLSGTWNLLMEEVNELTIFPEFFDGSETIGLDNIKISNDLPVTDFSADKIFAFCGDSIQFFDNSTNDPTEWQWNFDFRNTSTEKNPTYTYNFPGMYDVQLTTTNDFGSDIEMKQDYIEIADTSGNELYCDDFDDNVIHPAWSFINGTWVETNGSLKQSSNHYGTGWKNGCFALIGSPNFSDYTITFDFYSTDNDGIGTVFNYQDESNFYLFVWRAQTDYRAILKYEDGVETEIIRDTIAYTGNTWYNLELITINGNIICSVDSTEIFNVIDSSFVKGKAGLYCWANSSSYWDNFCLNKSQYLAEPQNLTTEVIGSEIHLSWDSVNDAASYSVYSSEDPNEPGENWTLEEANVINTSWSDIISEQKKFYYIRAVN